MSLGISALYFSISIVFRQMIVLLAFDFATCQRSHSSVASLYISDWQLPIAPASRCLHYTNNKV